VTVNSGEARDAQSPLRITLKGDTGVSVLDYCKTEHQIAAISGEERWVLRLAMEVNMMKLARMSVICTKATYETS
jgi:hypothetical protein